MSISKSNIVWTVVVVVCMYIIYNYYQGAYGTQYVTRDYVKMFIQGTYPNQFCDTIYPNFAECATFKPEECGFIAAVQLEPCVEQVVANLPDKLPREQLNELYDSVAPCLSENLHKEIMAKYLVDTPECRMKMQ